MNDSVTYGRSRSTGTSTTSGNSFPEYKIEYRGYYQVNKWHELESPLKKSLENLEAAAARFATDAISDGNVRASYQKNIQRMAQAVLEDVDTGKISAKSGMAFSNKMRNQIMIEHRTVTSAQGVAVAEKYKKDGRTIEHLLDKKSREIYGKGFYLLTATEQNKIYYAIIESSARSSAIFDKSAKRLSVMGKVGWIVTAALAAHAVLEARNKKKEVVRQGALIGGGMAGGAAAGLLVTPICGPGAPICAVAVVLVGSIIGGVVSEDVVDSLDEELEEFSKWQMK